MELYFHLFPYQYKQFNYNEVLKIKILAIISSNRKNGHTSKVISLIKERMEQLTKNKDDNLEFEKIFLGDYEINHCKGCRVCMDSGEELCPWKDDIPLIKEKMKKADATIFASPVYVGDVSSSMKALIDRLAYICHRQEFYKKYAMIVATTHQTSLKRTIHTMGAATYSWGFKTVGSKGFTTTSSNESKESLNMRYSKEISKLANRLYHNIKNNTYLKPNILSLASFQIQQKNRADPEKSNRVDYAYWKKKGWANPSKTYYIDHQAGMVKLFLSKILYKIMALMFT